MRWNAANTLLALVALAVALTAAAAPGGAQQASQLSWYCFAQDTDLTYVWDGTLLNATRAGAQDAAYKRALAARSGFEGLISCGSEFVQLADDRYAAAGHSHAYAAADHSHDHAAADHSHGYAAADHSHEAAAPAPTAESTPAASPTAEAAPTPEASATPEPTPEVATRTWYCAYTSIHGRHANYPVEAASQSEAEAIMIGLGEVGGALSSQGPHSDASCVAATSTGAKVYDCHADVYRRSLTLRIEADDLSAAWAAAAAQLRRGGDAIRSLNCVERTWDAPAPSAPEASPTPEAEATPEASATPEPTPVVTTRTWDCRIVYWEGGGRTAAGPHIYEAADYEAAEAIIRSMYDGYNVDRVECFEE